MTCSWPLVLAASYHFCTKASAEAFSFLLIHPVAAKRVGEEPAYILHQYDWSESSLILEVFTRHRGRVALAAKGVKRHTSNFRPVLLPLQPLKLSYTLGAEGNAEIHSLKGAEWVGGHVMPQGDALWSGMYLNELLLRLLAILTLISVAGGVALYFLSGNRKYLRFSFQLTRYAIGVALAIFALLFLERVAIIPF